MDGAEDAAAQPYGSALIYNFTAIGQPYDGDQGTEWRDNMRAQFHNCVFMDIGDKMVKDGTDGGDGGGYGSVGVPTLAELFATPCSIYPTNTVGVDPNVLYPNFTSGNWCQFTNCVFSNLHETDSLTTFGVMDASFGNVIAAADGMPIQGITRETPMLVADKVMARVTYLNPRAANDAVSSAEILDDGFITPAPYKGAFLDYNWLEGWTAAYAYGMTD
jgi:hypothetical protein